MPVVTITLYLGVDEWDGPRGLTDMMGKLEPEVLKLVTDYKINSIDPHEITDFTKFQTGLRLLLEMLKNASDEEKIGEVVRSDEAFKRVDMETVAAINLFVGTDIKVNEKEEVVNMCKAWDDHKAAGLAEGIIEMGEDYGISENEIVLKLQEKLNISSSKALEYMKMYSKQLNV